MLFRVRAKPVSLVVDLAIRTDPVMHKIFITLCIGLLLIAGQLPAYAQSTTKSKKIPAVIEKSNYLYLVPTIGVYTFDSGDDFKTGNLYGLVFGYQNKGKAITDRLGIEGFAAMIDSRARKDNQTVNGYLLRGEVVYDLIRARFVPFLSLGGGALILDAKDDSVNRYIVTPGLGVKYALTNHLDLRADFRRNFSFDPKDSANNEFTVGLTFLLDNVRTLATPPPPDADGDGVPDAVDRCPDTPRGKKVDQFGCPPDADGDGVPDFKDKCLETPTGARVDLTGCNTDNDGDGVPNELDLCPDTPPGIVANNKGCVPTMELTRISPVDVGIIVAKEVSSTPANIAPPAIPTAPAIGTAPTIVAVPAIVAAAALEPIYFQFDSYALTDKSKQLLRQNAQWLKANPGSKISVEGNCDWRGTKAYNVKLGEKRAQAAKSYLLTLGIDANLITVTSHGEENPIDPASSLSAAAKNRRVDFVPQ